MLIPSERDNIMVRLTGGAVWNKIFRNNIYCRENTTDAADFVLIYSRSDLLKTWFTVQLNNVSRE